MRHLAPLLAIALMGCATTPTVEQVNAERARVEAICHQKGYPPGSQDHRTCVALTQQQQLNDNMRSSTATTIGLGTAVGLAGIFLSDQRYKRDIEPVGTENGLTLYKFRYQDDDTLYVGLIAQDVIKTRPDAVIVQPGQPLRVNYKLLGISFRTWDQWSQSH